MDENMDYMPEEGYTQDSAPDDTAVPEGTGVEASPPDQEDQGEPGDIEERIDDLLDQIGAGQSFGSMGDYYVAEAGCYAFPGEDVFFHFIDEEARSGWTAASSGCYVPADSLDAYEAYLLSGMPEEGIEEGDGQEPLPPPVTQEDLAGLEGILSGIYAQEESFYQTSILHMESMEKTLADTQTQLYKTSVFLAVTCFFLAFLCGVKLADVFWSRMRAG